MKEFLVEVRSRAGEGYSTRQLMSSLIPDIGTEVKVADSEVTAEVKKIQVAVREQHMGTRVPASVDEVAAEEVPIRCL